MGGLEPQVMVPWLFHMCVHSHHRAEEPGGHAYLRVEPLSPGLLTLYSLGQGGLSLPWFPCSKDRNQKLFLTSGGCHVH